MIKLKKKIPFKKKDKKIYESTCQTHDLSYKTMITSSKTIYILLLIRLYIYIYKPQFLINPILKDEIEK
jgi:hypothetical protein